MALRPNAFGATKPQPDPEKEDNRPLPTDEDIARHLRIRPEVLSPTQKVESQNPKPAIEKPLLPGEGKI